MQRKFSIIIPTLFKRVDILNNLLSNLYEDPAVAEVILLDNTGEYFNYEFVQHAKLKIFPLEENIYVNPAWNLGVKISTEEYIGILNDDITIPERIFSSMSTVPFENLGVVGADHPSIIQTENPRRFGIDQFTLAEMPIRNWGFGIMMVLAKKNWQHIDDRLKVWVGDDLLFHRLRLEGKKNGVFKFPIETKMSATSNDPIYEEIKQNDLLIYEELKKQFNI